MNVGNAALQHLLAAVARQTAGGVVHLDEAVGLGVDQAYAGRNEGALGVILCVEEVGAEQVADQLLFGNGDGGDVDRTLDRDDSLVTDGDVALEACRRLAGQSD